MATMQIKMYQILDFPNFYALVKNQKITFKTSYRLAMLAAEVEKQYNFYTEQFRVLLDQYGQKDAEGNFIPTDDGQGVKLVQETMEECYTKVNELRDLDITLPDCYFSLDDFDGIELTPIEVNAIIPFIKM
jgi:hypothetical protein